MVEIFKHWLFVLLLGWAAVAASPARAEPTVPLTPDEKAWIQAHKTIRIGVDPAYPPFEFVDNKGVYSGMASDYLKLMGKRLGVTFKVVTGLTWTQVVEGTKDRTVDVAPVMTPTKGRREFLNFTQFYLNFPQVIVTRKDYPPIEGFRDLAGKTVAASKGYNEIEHIRRSYPTIELHLVDNPLEELEVVATGKAEAAQGSLAVFSYLIEKHNLLNLRIAAPSEIPGGAMAMGVRKDWSALTGILDKALESITEKEHHEIRNKWVAVAAPGESIDLSREEQRWLDEHPVLKVGNVVDWPPFDFVRNGEPKGYAINMVKLIADKVGVKVEFINGFTWSQLMTKFKAGEIDIMPAIGDTPKRREFAAFTRQYIANPIVLVARADNSSITDINSLRDKTLAVVSGYYYEDIVRKNHPEVGVLGVPGFVEGLEAVAYGKVDAFMGTLVVVNYTLNETALAGLRIIGPSGVKDVDFIKLSMGVPKDDAILAGILEKGLDAVLPEEKEALRRRWLGTMKLGDSKQAVLPEGAKAEIQLTDEETAWLKAHEATKIRVMVGTWPPFHFVEDGKPKGLAIDYVTTVLGRLGLQYELTPILWTEALAGISNLEKIDLLPTIARSPEREKLVEFTNDYLRFPSVIFGRTDASFAGSLKDYYGRTVAVEKNFIAQKRLQRDHPQIKLLIVRTSRDAIEAVSLGRADAYVGNLATGSYLIEKFGFANVKVAAPSGYPDNIQAMGVRKDWSELAVMIDKVLESMTEAEHNELRNKAISVRFEFGVDTDFITKVALLIGGVVVAIFVVFVVWNRSLGKEISERKQMQAKLAEKEAQISTALASMSGGLFMIDKDFNIKVVNEKIIEWYDLPEGVGRPGTPLRDFLSVRANRGEYGSGDPEELIEQRLEGYRDRSITRVEDQVPGGRILEVLRAPTDDGGMVVVCNDITQRKKDEEELRAAKDESEAATKAKASFLATMSHEIRTPMNGVIGMVDMLMQTKLEDDQHQMMRTVRDSAYALLTIINDILDFSKIEAGKLDLETIPLSIRDAVEGVCETLAPNANKKSIKINIHVDPNIPDAVLGDQVRLRQILFNLGGNAVKFSDEGRVLIRAYKVPARAKKKVTVRFEIIDSGIGISKEAQSELFKEFSQAESSTTRRFGGTGLGLSISQRLVEMMKGKIEVESELGEGSTFIVTLTFPIAEKHKIKSDGHDLSGLNILFVGEDAEERELDAKYLRHWDAEVTTIGGIQEAKSLALETAGEKKPFDIIALGSAWPLETRIAEIEAMQADKVLAGTRFALMTETRIKAERKDVKNTVYIESDPLRRASFIRGIAVAAGRASPEVEYAEEVIDLSKIKVPTVEEAEAAGTLILVAEDNPTNRDVIGRQLKLLGYVAEFRDDGKQALEAWRSKSYGMLLTDCHMPEMDGFELTQAIRDTEQDGGHRLPIIAITASALEAEVERCFEAGMDDFLAKPLEMPKLKAALKKWMPLAGAEAEPAAEEEAAKLDDAPDTAAGDGGDGPIDPSALKSVFGDDEDTFKEILQEFIEPATSNIGEIEASFADRSADGVAKAAHKLKSSARSVGASELADLCLTLETAGKAEDWSEIDEAAPRLSGVMKEISNYIEKL